MTTKAVNYYNEFDPYPAQRLRNLIALGFLPPGDVDERSIKDVKADDLKGYTQCHFFAGIGGWPNALALAGWPDNRPVWTGSCPCQPFSVAGRGAAQKDDRHLWPEWYRLIRECRPATIFGEQVSGAITHGWLDEVYQDMEREGYAVGSAVLPACGVGSPHKRDRLWFVADSSSEGSFSTAYGRIYSDEERPRSRNEQLERYGETMCVSDGTRRNARQPTGANARHWHTVITASSNAGIISNTKSQQTGGVFKHKFSTNVSASNNGGGKTGFWQFEPFAGRVANGIPSRVGRLRAYGNAIVPQVAQTFIEAFMECQP